VGAATVCHFIDAEKATEDNPDGYGVALLCRTLGVGRSTYYAWLASQPAVAERRCEEDELADRIREIHVGSRGAYGVPRVHAALRRAGQVINRKKVERIMRERDIRGVTRRRRRCLTRQDATASPAPDPVGRDFTADEPGTKLVDGSRSSSLTSRRPRRARRRGCCTVWACATVGCASACQKRSCSPRWPRSGWPGTPTAPLPGCAAGRPTRRRPRSGRVPA
jgi:hypothetical protein